MILELCLVPKNIIDNLLDSDINVASKNVKKVNFENKIKKNENLYPIINSTFKAKSKQEKAKNLYAWILHNVSGFETLENGEIISPLKNINILDFMQDIFSNSTKFSKEKLNLYKIFISIIDIPHFYIDNKIIKKYLFPNIINNDKEINISKTSKKRKIETILNKSPEKKIKNDEFSYENVNDDDDDITDEDNDYDGNETVKAEKYIDKKYRAYPGRIRKKTEKYGSGIKYTKRKPQIKWTIF